MLDDVDVVAQRVLVAGAGDRHVAVAGELASAGQALADRDDGVVEVVLVVRHETWLRRERKARDRLATAAHVALELELHDEAACGVRIGQHMVVGDEQARRGRRRAFSRSQIAHTAAMSGLVGCCRN